VYFVHTTVDKKVVGGVFVRFSLRRFIQVTRVPLLTEAKYDDGRRRVSRSFFGQAGPFRKLVLLETSLRDYLKVDVVLVIMRRM
jgi:hypothetical protein